MAVRERERERERKRERERQRKRKTDIKQRDRQTKTDRAGAGANGLSFAAIYFLRYKCFISSLFTKALRPELTDGGIDIRIDGWTDGHTLWEG